ncbi:MAG: biotin--protein ligase [Candidatus Micrarchaeaceae archaeon]
MISVKLTYGKSIEGIQILGDFFINPEESLAEIEKALSGASITDSKEDIAARIAHAAHLNHAEFIGVTPDSIAEAIYLAIANGR